MTSNKQIIERIHAWIGLSRPPFHTVGVLPFLLGTFLSWKMEGIFNQTVFLFGVSAVVLIMLSSYHSGEFFDENEDRISKNIFKSKFAGGSGILPANLISRWVPLWTSIITFLAAGVVGLALQFYFKTGPYTILLGCLGALPGFFYSTKPIRLVERGIGEIFIGFCYGWLPVASAFYIQTGYINPVIHWMGIPIGLTIFNVILLNEFPDYAADSATHKKNILVRIGKKWGGILYTAISVMACLSMIITFMRYIPAKGLYLYIPVLLLSIVIVTMMAARKYKNQEVLEIMCGLNIVVNLGTTGSYLLAFA